MSETNQLGTQPLGRLLVKMAAPTVVAQLINMLYNLVDRIYIGHIPGEGAYALTGMGVCMPVIMVVSAFAMLAGAGGGPRASIFMGRGDNEPAEKILGNCFTLLLCISVVITAILLGFGEELLMAFGATENTIGYATAYMNVYALGTVFVQMTLGMNSFIIAQGFSKTGMLSVLIGAISNIILDPIFIFGLHLGVVGAALATIISQAISSIWVVGFLMGKKTTLKLRAQNMPLKRKIILPCVGLGLATFIMMASESVISVCFNTSLRTYGGDIAVGAMTILISVTQFALLPLQGLGQGAQPIISFNYGAGNVERVKKTYFLLLRSSLVYSVLLWALVILFPVGFASIFTSDAALIEFAAPAIRCYCAMVLIFGIQISCQMTFTALGKAKASIIVAVMRKFVLLMPLIYIMPHIFTADKTMAVYLAEPVADIIAVTFTAILFAFQFRKVLKQMRMLAGSPELAE